MSSPRTWTTNDLATLRDLRVNKLLTFAEIARCGELPGRTAVQIQGACQTHRIRIAPTPRRITKAQRRTIRALHAMGKGNTEIGECVNMRRESIRIVLKSMGLPTNRWTQRHRDRIRDARQAWVKREGMSSVGEPSMVAWRRKVAATGWPINCKFRETSILDVLESHQKRADDGGGGLTRVEILEAAEFNIGPSGECVGNRYIDALLRAGLIVRCGPRRSAKAVEVRPHGGGRPPMTYALAPGVKRKRLALPTREERRIAEMELLRRVAS